MTQRQNVKYILCNECDVMSVLLLLLVVVVVLLLLILLVLVLALFW